jgi:carboxypeptidase family protein
MRCLLTCLTGLFTLFFNSGRPASLPCPSFLLGWKRVLGIVAVGLMSPLIFAQGLSTIVGTVTDPSGAAVPSARVTAVETLTHLSRSVVANAQGYFVIPSLRPNTYDLTVEAPGFEKYSRTNVPLLASR